MEKKTMAARKNPNNGFFAGAPPSVNFFTSIDDEISDPIAPDQDAADQELLARETENKLRLNKKKDLKQDRPEYNEEQNATLGSADSEIFDSGPFQSASIGGTSGHVVSSPFEISHYPIEIQENRKAMQRQISSRKKKEKVPEPSSNDRGRRWSLQPRMESSRGDQLNQFTSGANTPSTERNSQCVSPMSPSRSMTSGALQVDSGPKLMDALDAMKEQKESQRIEMHTFRDAIDVNYQRMALTEEELSGVPLEDLKAASKFLIEGVRLRQEYMEMIGCHFPSTTKHFLHGHYPDNLPKCRKKNTEVSAHTSFHPPEPPSDHWGTSQPLPIYEKKYKLKRHRGTVAILDDRGEIVPELKKYYITKEKYLKDYERLIIMTANGPLKSFSYRRLAFLQTKFQLHVLLNDIRELHEQKSVPHRDFYNIRKVDTHIHAASSMNQKHLLRFIKKKMKTEADVVVHEQNGKKITMRQLFESLGLGAYDLSVDMLDVHADRNTFHRFDKFNTKYNPVGQSVLRDVFIKTDNYVGGKYFAEVLKEVFSDLEDSKYQQAEPRISIYGRKKDEWDKLAKWAITHDVWSTNIRWIIQVPRLFDVYKSKSMIANFDDFLDNLFTPLFEVTNDPSSHPELHCFLQYVTAMDSVDDESKHEYVHFDLSTPEPINYATEENPPYSYYLYYMYANLAALNAFRRMRGLNTIALKTHCGEAGHINHLMVGYLTSESIAHGLLLRKVPVLQYLFYLCQIGIAMSPLSNNSLFISYPRNPLPEYLMKGLNVSLSTDDPLQFHFTKEALMEEFSIAAQVWKLSGADMCELARNSVLQSGFEDKVKIHWLGPNYKEEGVLGNDVARTNVPDIRVSFRHEALVDELNNLFRASHF